MTNVEGEAVRNLNVDLYHEGSTRANEGSSVDRRYVPDRTEQTDDHGCYAFDGLAARQYRVFFRAWGYADSPYVAEWFDDFLDLRCCEIWEGNWPPSTPVELGTGEHAEGIDAVLDRPGTISGTMSTPASGCSDREIFIVSESNAVEPYDSDSGIYGPFSADADGAWSKELPPGKYRVQFDWCGSTEWWTNTSSRGDADLIEVPAGGSVTGIDAEHGLDR